MKATIDIPDDLYRKVKAKSALEGRPIRAVTVELYRRWLSEDAAGPGQASAEWLEEWLRLADTASESAPLGPSAREILEQDRDRLDRR
jgi:hypothetical protein